MKIGDLVRFSDTPATSKGRIFGIVLRMDMYRNRGDIKLDSNDAFGAGPVTPLVEVLWNNGPCWIAATRVKKVELA
jgi:hypothetical protein